MRLSGWIVLALLATAAASAQPTSVAVTMSLTHSPLGNDMAFHDPAPTGGVGQLVAACQSSHLTLPPGQPWFRFRETETENGCAEARVDLPVPPDADRLTITFQANRVVTQATPLAQIALRIHQDLHLYYDGAARPTSSFQVFDPSDPASVESVTFRFQLALDPDASEVGVGLFFFDEGESVSGVDGPTLVGTQVSSTVRDLRIRFEGMTAPVTMDHASGTAGDQFVHRTTLRIPFEEQDAGLPGAFITAAADSTVGEFHGPQAPLSARSLLIEEQDGIRTFEIPPELVAQYGYGDYELQLRTTSPLTSTPTMVPIFLAMLISPGIAGAVSTRSLRPLRLQTYGGFARAASQARLAIGVLVAAYVVLLGAALLGPGYAVMTAWPIGLTAGIVYALLAILTILFLGIGILWKQQLNQLMRGSLDEQRSINDELARSNRELEQFAYIASHDLQEPLRTVYGYAQLLDERYSDDLDEDAKEFLGFVVKGADRMSVLVADLLDFSRAGRELHTETIDMERLAGLVAADLADEEATITIGHMPEVVGDPVLMRQLLQNLLSNGVKFRKEGAKARVEVVGTRQGDEGHFKVADHGIGIAKRDREKAFVIFQRLHTRDEYPGTGIGLALCQKIVEAHGGRIELRATPGGGTTVFFALPLAGPS